MKSYLLLLSILIIICPGIHAQQSSKIKIGANLDAISDYSGTPVFVDLMKSSRKILKGTQWDTAATVDADGWPTEDCQIIFQAIETEWQSYLTGTYKLSFTGRADISDCCASSVSIANKHYDSLSNTTTADVILNGLATTPEAIIIVFKNTQQGVKNIKLIRPNQDSTQLFTKEFKEHVNRFSVLRFMDWQSTNSSPENDFSKRLTPQSASQNVAGKSVAYEYIAQLANETGKDIWINVPAKADDGFVQAMAGVFKTKLNPSIKIYLEYSNELWNFSGGFAQCYQTRAMARNEVNSGSSNLDDPDGNKPLAPGDSGTWQVRFVARRAMEIGNIFRQEFNESTPFGRVRPVLAGQYVNMEPIIIRGLRFINQYYGKPNRYFYAIASAPYFYADAVDTSSTLGSKQDYLDELKRSAEAQYKQTFTPSATGIKTFDNWITRATFYGLKHVMYEGGQHLFGAKNMQAKRESQEDPQIKDIYYNYFYNFYKTIDTSGFAMQFVCGSTKFNTQYGMWGLSHNFSDVETAPKTQAIDSLCKQDRPLSEVGWPIENTGDSVDTRKFVYHTYGSGTNWNLTDSCACNPFLNAGNFNGYLLNVKTAGKYYMSLRTQRPLVKNKRSITDVYLNNTLIDSIVVLNSAANDPKPVYVLSDSIVMNFPLGLNAIELRYRGENSSNRSILFTKIDETGLDEIDWNTHSMLIYPQPVSDQFRISYFVSKAGSVEISWRDITGRLVRSDVVKATPGENTVMLNANNVNRGVFILTVRNLETSEIQTGKLIVE